MNREIKFRAWDKKDKFFYYNDDLSFLRFDELPELLKEYNLELMQYTGLKDKNGKEIYEGDILKCEEGNDEIIEFKNGAFICRYRTTNLYYLWLNQYIEVIGNIFENPELLKTKNINQ